MNTNEFWTLVALIAAFVVSFAGAFALVVGLPVYGVYRALRLLALRK